MDDNEPKRVVEITSEEIESRQSLEDSEQNWSFLIPFAVPVLIVLLIAFAFVSFGKKENGPLSGFDLNEATKSGTVAGTQTKAVAQGPKVPPSPKASKSPQPTPSPVPSPTPESSNNNPSPSPSPSPLPPETPESLNWTQSSCTESTFIVNLSWAKSGSGWEVHLDDDSSFGSYSKKNIDNQTSAEAPSGFDPDLVLNTGTIYRWRIWNGSNYTSGPDILVSSCT